MSCIIIIDSSTQNCTMGFLKKKSLQVIVDAPRDNRIFNAFNFSRVANVQSMPISESGSLVKFFVATKFDHTIPSGWPVLQIRRRIHTIISSSYFRVVFSTTMEPRPTGYLNVFEYDVQNMAFNVQHNDSIRVFWPRNTNVLRRYSLAYFRDSSNVMLSIEIGQTISTTEGDSTSTPEPQTMVTMEGTEITAKESTTEPKGEQDTTTMSSTDKNLDGTRSTTHSVSSYESFISHKVTTVTTITTGTSVPETSTRAQTQAAIITGGVLCALAVIVLLVVLVIAVFVVLQCRSHTKDFSPNTNDLKTLPPVLDNPTYSLVDGKFYKSSNNNNYYGYYVP